MNQEWRKEAILSWRITTSLQSIHYLLRSIANDTMMELRPACSRGNHIMALRVILTFRYLTSGQAPSNDLQLPLIAVLTLKCRFWERRIEQESKSELNRFAFAAVTRQAKPQIFRSQYRGLMGMIYWLFHRVILHSWAIADQLALVREAMREGLPIK